MDDRNLENTSSKYYRGVEKILPEFRQAGSNTDCTINYLYNQG